MLRVRPGSSTANAVIRRQEQSPGCDPLRADRWWVQRVTVDVLNTAATSQALNLNTQFTTNPFPTDVFILPGTYVDLRVVFAGGAVNACTIILGDTNDDDGLLTSTNVFTGQSTGVKCTPSAAEYRSALYESAFVPLLTINTTNGNVSALTTGTIDIWIPYSLRPSSRPA